MSLNNLNFNRSTLVSFKEKLFLCLLLYLLNCSFSLAQSHSNINKDTTVLKVTVANIFEKENEDHINVNFYESSRGYVLYKKNKRYLNFIKMLRASKEKSLMIEISFVETTDHLLMITDIKK